MIDSEPLTSAAITDAKTTAGYRVGFTVPSDSKVYIVGNIPAADASTVAACTTLADIKVASSLISTQNETDKYKTAPLANSDGNAVAIAERTPASGNNLAVYAATVNLSPVISRLELVSIKGGADADGNKITSFRVTNIYVDKYYSAFTYGGDGAGSLYELGTATTYGGIYTDAVNTNSSLVSSVPTVAPASSKVWAYNVAPKGVPTFVIALTNVKWLPAGGADPADIQDMGSTVYYLSVKGYTGISAFERGKVYRIGVPGVNDFVFNIDHLSITPNPTDVDLYVTVDILDWELETPNAEL